MKTKSHARYVAAKLRRVDALTALEAELAGKALSAAISLDVMATGMLVFSTNGGWRFTTDKRRIAAYLKAITKLEMAIKELDALAPRPRRGILRSNAST